MVIMICFFAVPFTAFAEENNNNIQKKTLQQQVNSGTTTPVSFSICACFIMSYNSLKKIGVYPADFFIKKLVDVKLSLTSLKSWTKLCFTNYSIL